MGPNVIVFIFSTVYLFCRSAKKEKIRVRAREKRIKPTSIGNVDARILATAVYIYIYNIYKQVNVCIYKTLRQTRLLQYTVLFVWHRFETHFPPTTSSDPRPSLPLTKVLYTMRLLLYTGRILVIVRF